MTPSSAPKRERRQSKTKSRRALKAFFRRPWLLKLLLAMAPVMTKLVELVILFLKQPK